MFAKRITKEEYDLQSKEYTKKALEELNKQLKAKANDKSDMQEPSLNFLDEDEDSNLIPEQNTKNNIRVVRQFDNASETLFRKKEQLLETLFRKKEQLLKKITNLENDLINVENKNHYMTLELSNCTCELESTKEKLNTMSSHIDTINKYKLWTYVYIVILNVFLSLHLFKNENSLFDYFFYTPIVSTSMYICRKLYPIFSKRIL